MVAQWILEGSGWTVQSVDGHYLSVVRYQPLAGSSYIELPQELQNPAKGLMNFKNEDNECFRWCHIRHLNLQDKDPQRQKQLDWRYIKNLDYTGVEFPVSGRHYKKIERQNKINMNVFAYEEELYPIYLSKEKHETIMNLLVITEEKEEDGVKVVKSHYVLIKDFNKLM